MAFTIKVNSHTQSVDVDGNTRFSGCYATCWA